ncbi:MurR/RpiR family transcriptional regulator [Pontivivens insulae]|uniref:Putative HTH-type transcriptional regulator YbbH n=1 Tax=Pontivivens insulae TaxID=1639689 RepID=A0A2R8AFV8_9RHOB|nr:MurR/RpiR family transcriptional regulator [Pontivivens insulae]RED12204.1 RpiR family transcriptional regulator [Pontivivens insulae]SPF30960.1 putative HTH-type transcriptional regulator YbbH [Pontivivens insulae]
MNTENRFIARSSELDTLRARLLELRKTAPPKVASFADWALGHPQELAFNSVRSLATLANVNANTVVRLAQSLGYDGFDPCRRAFQEALRQNSSSYTNRAAKLKGEPSERLFDEMHQSAVRNIEGVFDVETRRQLERAATMLLEARQAYIIGVRSCFSLAHYLSYCGGMAFKNFVRRSSEPGDIYDLMARAQPGDVVVPITFSHYSTETIRAHALARQRGLKIIAITDDIRAPIADGSDIVLIPRMDGPQAMPSLVAAFTLIEALVATMLSRSEGATTHMREFEDTLLECGAYVGRDARL